MSFGRLIVATRNPAKLRELRELLEPRGLEALGLNELDPDGALRIVESGRTFRDNALIKARAVAGAFGVPGLGEDSGLSVAALGGAPGVLSARYHGLTDAELRRVHPAYPGGRRLRVPGAEADELNNTRLLAELEGVADRRAHYTCALALVDAAGGILFSTRGEVQGLIGDRRRGDGGFGYDPLFHPAGDERTFAQYRPEEKHAVSHRGRALARLTTYLREVGP